MGRAAREVASRPYVVGGACWLGALVAYLPGLGRALDYDSAQTVGSFVLLPWPFDALARQSAFNNHPFFSLLESGLHWLTGSSEEAVLRVLPILFGAAAVGLLAGWAARRWGALAGVTAGAVLAVNPMFAGLSRSVRGYSLLVLCAVGSTLLLGRLLGDPATRSSRTAIGYAVVVAVGLATHLYMGLVLVTHVAVVAAHRSVDRRLVQLWALAAAGGVAIYARIGPGMVDAALTRGRDFKPRFPGDLAESLLGGRALVVALLVPPIAAGTIALWRLLDVRVAVVTVIAGMAAAWLSAGTDLGPRFFVWAVPAVAAVAAAGVAARPPLAVLAGAAVIVSAVSQAGEWADPPSRYPEVAAVIDDLDKREWHVCVLDLSVPPLLAYTDRFHSVTDADHLEPCDAAVTVSTWLDGDLADQAAERLPHHFVLDPDEGAMIYASRPVPGLAQ